MIWSNYGLPLDPRCAGMTERRMDPRFAGMTKNEDNKK